MNPYETIPFTNEFGQVIQPGQSCVIVAKGRSGGISTYRGRYLGVRRYEVSWRKEPQYNVVAEVTEEVNGYFDPDTGKKLSWTQGYERKLEREKRTVTRITNLYLNLIYPSDFA